MSSKDLFFTTSSVLTDKKVLRKLVNTGNFIIFFFFLFFIISKIKKKKGKKAVAPLLNEKNREFRTNVWMNTTQNGFYASSPFYYKIIYRNFNGLWVKKNKNIFNFFYLFFFHFFFFIQAVPVIVNTYLLKSELIADLIQPLQIRNRIINNGKTENLFADVEISRELVRQSIFPRLINQISYGLFNQDYTIFSTNLFFRKFDEDLWKKTYLVQENSPIPISDYLCSKPRARNNFPLVYRCNSFNSNFVNDFQSESNFLFNDNHRVDTSSFKKNLFSSFFRDSCLTKVPFVDKYSSNLEGFYFSFIADNSYSPPESDSLDESVCVQFPKE